MPVDISYTLLVHAGSYKDFLKKFEKNFPNMEIEETKVKAIHYYIIHIKETGKAVYKKEDIYKLPIMAMREEFSNYLFFKSVKAYNNVLRIMFKDREEKDIPYLLYQEMLTPLEKYMYADIDKDTKEIKYSITKQNNEELETTVFNSGIFNKSTIEDIFTLEKIKVDDEDKTFADLIKDQKLLIGII